MGNAASSSEGAGERPPLHARVSSSSTNTITPSKSNIGKDLGQARRRSLDLPDVYAKDLAFTSASPPSPVDSYDAGSNKWPRRSNTRGRSTPSSKSAKAGPAISQTIAAGVSSSANAAPPVSAAVGSSAPLANISQPQGPQPSISMTLDAAESQASMDTASTESHTGGAEGALTPTASGVLDPSMPVAEQEALQLSPPVPQAQALPFPNLPFMAPTSSSYSTTSSLGVMTSTVHPPLTPPIETVVAPYVPASIAPLPLGNGASTTTSLIVGQPLPLAARVRTPSNEHPLPPSPISPLPPIQGSATLEAEAAGGDVPVALPASAFPLPADFGASPPNRTILPAAAPISATPSTQLATDVKAQEAVVNATVDLDAGPDAVPTLLTWRPSATADGGEGGVPGGKGPPTSVYVTGTFAKGWGTKIQMRKKNSASDFSAIIALPPGQHQLKFIVDKQWTTSRNLPSATDPDGNLINYLVVRGPQHPPAYPPGIGLEEDLDDAVWGTEIPPPIQQLGSDLDAFEAEERKYKLGQSPPPEYPYRYQLLQKVVPPSLPAPLKDVPLNKALMVAQGSGDDNSILAKPDHSILDHLCASPISKGLLSVAVTKRYRKKFVTTILYKPIAP